MAVQRVIVAGAGLSGLACAFDLARSGAEVVVLEAAERAGGVVGTFELEGFRFETGPNTVPASSDSFRRLCADLHIAERLIASSPAAEERYLFDRGRLRRVPTTPAEFLASDLLSIGGRLRACSEVFRRWRPPAAREEPDLEAFFTERVGAEAARVLAGAFVRGVYAAEMRELGAKSAFPRLWRACMDHGGLVRGLRAAARTESAGRPGPDLRSTALLSFPRGLVEIVDALVASLGGCLRTKTTLASIERRADVWIARTSSGESLECDHVVLAVGAPVAAKLLVSAIPDQLASSLPIDHLKRIGHASITLVHLGFGETEIPHVPPGFGYLVPPPSRESSPGAPREMPRALGTLFVSNLFPGRTPAGCVSMSSFYSSGDVVGVDERGLVELACADLAMALGGPLPVRISPARVAKVQRWSDVIPRYAPGHSDRIAELVRDVSVRLPGLHLSGNYVAGLSVDQVITCGRSTAEQILRDRLEVRSVR